MHYGTLAFSSNRLPTITPKKPGVTIGQHEKMSTYDVEAVRLYYSKSIKTTPMISLLLFVIFLITHLKLYI
jgi:hypothetical protein